MGAAMGVFAMLWSIGGPIFAGIELWFALLPLAIMALLAVVLVRQRGLAV